MSIPTRHIMSIYFFAELFFLKESAQALTINAAMKPLILLNGAGQLGPNTFQLFSELGVGILEFVPFLLHPIQHTLAGLELAQQCLPVRILSGGTCNVIFRLARTPHSAYVY